MWAAPAAVAAVAVSALVAVVPAQGPAVLAQLQPEPELVVRAPLPAALVVPADLPLAVADLAADSVAVHLLSRQSFSAAMARSTT